MRLENSELEPCRSILAPDGPDAGRSIEPALVDLSLFELDQLAHGAEVADRDSDKPHEVKFVPKQRIECQGFQRQSR